MSERIASVEGYRFLDRDEYNQHRDYFQHLTEKIRFIGDVDLLRTAREDFNLIREISDRRGEYADFDTAANSLLGIIGAGPEHTLLTKTVATMKYCDLCVEKGEIAGETSRIFMENFDHAVRTEPDQHGSIVLSGALYARLLYHSLGSGSDNGVSISSLHRNIVGTVDTKEKEINMLGVVTAASTLAEMFDQDVLKPRLPVVTIVQNKTANHEQDSDATFPDKTMYLAIGKLASVEKLKEAAIWGVPDNSRVILTRRGLRALVGVQVNKPLSQDRTGDESIVSIKNLVHTNIAPLRLWDSETEKVFDDPLFLRADNVRRRCAFDSMSYWLAVRVSRDLKDMPDGGDNWTAAQRRINRWLDRFDEVLATTESGESITVMGEALREYNKRHPDRVVTTEDIKTHLRRNASALVLDNQRGKLTVRSENDISELYKEHIWDGQLKAEDKIELTVAYLEDRDSRYSGFDDEIARNIRLFASGRGTLTDSARTALLTYADNIVCGHLVLRFETIRNKDEPETLRQTLLQPGATV